MKKGVAAVTTAGMAAGVLYVGQLLDGWGCVGEAIKAGTVGGQGDPTGRVKACFGQTAVQGSIDTIIKTSEASEGTVQIQTVGQVVMKLRTTAAFDVDNTGYKASMGNMLGTDSTVFLNENGDKDVTLRYNPCLNPALEGADIGTPVSDAPVSPIKYEIIPDDRDNAKIKQIKFTTPPLQTCFMRISNSADEPGGLQNNQLWTQKGLGFTDGNAADADIYKPVIMAEVYSLLKLNAMAQACPEKALADAGFTAEKVKGVVATAGIGALIESFRTSSKFKDKPEDMKKMVNAVTDAYLSGRIAVDMGKPQDRIQKYEKQFTEKITSMRGKTIRPVPDVKIEFTNIADIRLDGSCGVNASIGAQNSVR